MGRKGGRKRWSRRRRGGVDGEVEWRRWCCRRGEGVTEGQGQEEGEERQEER